MTRPRDLLMLPLLVACAAVVAPVPAAEAQEPTVLDFCFVHRIGLVYRIDPAKTLPGHLPPACKRYRKHFAFSITDADGADHGRLTGLGDDDHPEYVREGEAAGGDLAGSYPDPLVGGLQGNAVAATAPADAQVLSWNGTDNVWEPSTPAGGIQPGDAAGGDLGGTYPDPAVTAINGNALGTGTPNTGDVLTWSGTSWDAAAPTGGGVTDHGALTGLGNDDHTQYVLADGVRATTNGFAVTGTLNSGTIPTSGGGVRMMWYPGKAAFRAGQVQGTRWDDANIGFFSVAMGFETIASGVPSTALGSSTIASGANSTATGVRTTASGRRSTAMGSAASTNGQEGAFVYGDNSSGTDVTATAPNQFVVRAAGGTTFFSNSELTAGVSLAPGAGAWSAVSDRNKKEEFRDEDGEAALQRIANLPIQSWSYTSQDPAVRHLGPMAQDFYAAFGLGESDTTITTTDIDGVNMLAIQALEKRTRALQQEIEMLRAGMQALLRVAADALVDRPDSDVDPQLARSVIELVLDHLDAPEKQPDPSTTPSPTTPTERRLP